MRRIVLIVAAALLLPSPRATAGENDADCDALLISAAFIAAQRHSVRANPEGRAFASAPTLALQNANWAAKMVTVFEALGKQARTSLGRSAFSNARASLSELAAEPVEGPRADPGKACAAAPNRGPRLVLKQLKRLLGLERSLLQACERACRPGLSWRPPVPLTLSTAQGRIRVREVKVLPGRTMRITSKGQVTIPLAIRRRLGLQPETEVEFDVSGDAVRIRKARRPHGGRGAAVVARLKGRATVRLTTDEIMALTRG